jgi:hypothetical protein
MPSITFIGDLSNGISSPDVSLSVSERPGVNWSVQQLKQFNELRAPSFPNPNRDEEKFCEYCRKLLEARDVEHFTHQPGILALKASAIRILGAYALITRQPAESALYTH